MEDLIIHKEKNDIYIAFVMIEMMDLVIEQNYIFVVTNYAVINVMVTTRCYQRISIYKRNTLSKCSFTIV